MALICELHFWTLKDEIFIKDNDIGCFRVHDKSCLERSSESSFAADKQEYAEGRDIVWNPSNKRPEKLRDNLKELEELMSNHRCVSIKWETYSPLQIVFNNGIMASVAVNVENCNIENVSLDNYLTGRLVSDHVVDVILDGNYLLVSYVEPKLTCAYLTKSNYGKSAALFTPKKGEKLSSLDPKLITIDLVGPGGRRMERKLSLNSSKDCLLVWWHNAVDEVWPWTPLNSTQDRVNMLVYSLNGPVVELLCSTRIDAELITAKFSYYQPSQIFTLEESVARNRDISVDVCIYEIAQGKCLQVSLTTIPLHGHIVSSCWSPSEDKLLLACDDCSLVMYDMNCHATHLATTQFLVMETVWHPSGTVVIVSSERGQLQCFDAALSCIKLQLMTEDVVPSDILEIPMYFRHQPSIFRLMWQETKSVVNVTKHTANIGYDTLCLVYESGPLAFLRFSINVVTQDHFTPLELIIQYNKSGQVDEAICLLLSLDWNRQGELCFQCLQFIVNYLLRRSLNHNREAQLEAALGTFYNPSEALPEVIIIEYRDQVGHLARRFFHQLLRFQRLDKAFLLAVDLGCRDLFLDLYHVAQDKGELALADVALKRAKELASNLVVSASDTGESVEYDDDLTEFSDDSSREDNPVGHDKPLPQLNLIPHKNLPSSSSEIKSGGNPLESGHQLTQKYIVTSKPLSYKWPEPCSQRKPSASTISLNSLKMEGSYINYSSQPETNFMPEFHQNAVDFKNQYAVPFGPPCSSPFKVSKTNTSFHMLGDMQHTTPRSTYSNCVNFPAEQNQLNSCHQFPNKICKQNQPISNETQIENTFLFTQQPLENSGYAGCRSNQAQNNKAGFFLSENKTRDSGSPNMQPSKTIDRNLGPCLQSSNSSAMMHSIGDPPFTCENNNDNASFVPGHHNNAMFSYSETAHAPQWTDCGTGHSSEYRQINIDHSYMQDYLDDDDVEGARVKFVHFGVV